MAEGEVVPSDALPAALGPSAPAAALLPADAPAGNVEAAAPMTSIPAAAAAPSPSPSPEPAVRDGDVERGADDMVAASVSCCYSFGAFVPIALAPKWPPIYFAGLEPFDVLCRWITAYIYITSIVGGFLFVLFQPNPFWVWDSILNVQGHWECRPYMDIGGAIGSFIYTFISSFCYAWLIWYCTVNQRCNDARCPCCIGKACYLILGILAVLTGLLPLGAFSSFFLTGCTPLGLVELALWLVNLVPCFMIGKALLCIYNPAYLEAGSPSPAEPLNPN